MGGGGGVYINIFRFCPISFCFEIKLISKEVSRAEPEYMNTPPPPISVLAAPRGVGATGAEGEAAPVAQTVRGQQVDF